MHILFLGGITALTRGKAKPNSWTFFYQKVSLFWSCGVLINLLAWLWDHDIWKAIFKVFWYCLVQTLYSYGYFKFFYSFIAWDVIGFPKSAMALYNPSLSPMYPKTELAAPPKSDNTFSINCWSFSLLIVDGGVVVIEPD